MIKILVMVVKRSDISDEQFRSHYEQSHAPLALKIFGDLFLEFRRNYPGRTTALMATADEAGSSPASDAGRAYDAITEVVLRDEAALRQMNEIYARPEVRQALAEDEERFMDRKASRMGVVETCESRAHIVWG